MPRRPRRLRRTQHRDRLMAVVSETVALYHRLRWVAEQIYGEEGRSAAVRGVLRGLVRYGAQTVPMLARTRFVTRQYMQELVDKLIASGLAERTPNPRHRRSPLVRATTRGETLVRRMDEIDERVLVAAVGHVAGHELEVTERTLRAFRRGFEQGARWQALASGGRGGPA